MSIRYATSYSFRNFSSKVHLFFFPLLKKILYQVKKKNPATSVSLVICCLSFFLAPEIPHSSLLLSCLKPSSVDSQQEKGFTLGQLFGNPKIHREKQREEGRKQKCNPSTLGKPNDCASYVSLDFYLCDSSVNRQDCKHPPSREGRKLLK